ncbi:MAG: radical SAM protein [Candidatus Caldatribacteriota bacterium]|nr:radical SAM protein [Candidatus Caldatribacteriota bacterium]
MITRSLKPFIFENRNLHRPMDYFNLPNLGLYVHVPFCREICPFCPYYKVKYDASLASRYVDALIKEIYLKSANTSTSKKKITSLYFGGGSPALVINYLGKILETFRKYFIIEGNIGIELHPDNVNPSLIAELKDIGFDIISLGVQSFNEKILQTLGRKGKSANRKKLKMIAEKGLRAVDVDIIFGIPGQTPKVVEEDIRKAAECGATQISTYPFIDFSYANNQQKPLDKKEKKLLLNTILKTCEEIGFIRTSVWTFARENTPRYSSITRDNYLGFGPSATTLLRKDFRINTFSVTEYINILKNNNFPTALILDFSERARQLYWLFWSCYNLNIDKNNFFKLFNKNLDSEFWLEKKIGELLGIVEYSENCYKLNDKGAYLFHLVEQKYTDQYIDKTWGIARDTPWPEKIVLY